MIEVGDILLKSASRNGKADGQRIASTRSGAELTGVGYAVIENIDRVAIAVKCCIIGFKAVVSDLRDTGYAYRAHLGREARSGIETVNLAGRVFAYQRVGRNCAP